MAGLKCFQPNFPPSMGAQSSDLDGIRFSAHDGVYESLAARQFGLPGRRLVFNDVRNRAVINDTQCCEYIWGSIVVSLWNRRASFTKPPSSLSPFPGFRPLGALTVLAVFCQCFVIRRAP